MYRYNHVTFEYDHMIYLFSSANKCLVKVATLCSNLQQFERAAEIFEQVSDYFFNFFIYCILSLLPKHNYIDREKFPREYITEVCS